MATLCVAILFLGFDLVPTQVATAIKAQSRYVNLSFGIKPCKAIFICRLGNMRID
jgi:hypothetical protein